MSIFFMSFQFKAMHLTLWIISLILAKIIQASNLTCTKEFCLPSDYNRLIKPFPNQPVNIKCDLDILQILEINDGKFYVTFSMYFGVQWEEPRLIQSTVCQNSYFSSKITFPQNAYNQLIWIFAPKFYDNCEFFNLKTYQIFEFSCQKSRFWD